MALRTIQGGLTVAAPACPGHYLDATKNDWKAYWGSELIEAIINIDLVSVEAYFRLLDQWRRIQLIAEKEPFSVGSTGQTTSHPAVAQAHQLLVDLTKLGEALGINPLARQRLGITSAKRALTAAELNKMVTEESGPRKKPAARGRVLEAEWEAVD